MIRHVVMAAALPGATDDQIDELLSRWRALPSEIPDILTLDAGRNLAFRDARYGLAAVSDFEDKAAWERFMEHPRHVALRDEVSSKVLDPATVATVQFEL